MKNDEITTHFPRSETVSTLEHSLLEKEKTITNLLAKVKYLEEQNRLLLHHRYSLRSEKLKLRIIMMLNSDYYHVVHFSISCPLIY